MRSIGAHAADRELGVPAGVDAHRRGKRPLHCPVIQNTHRRLFLGHGEGVGEALPVDLQGGRHLTGLSVLILVGGYFFDDQQRGRRGHHVIGQEDPLIIIHAGIDHRRRRARLTSSQQIQVLTHLSLGRTRTIRNLDRHHTSNHQHHENADQNPNQLHALLPLSGHRRKSHTRTSRHRRPRNRRGHRRCRYRSHARIVLLGAHRALLTIFDKQQPEGSALHAPPSDHAGVPSIISGLWPVNTDHSGDTTMLPGHRATGEHILLAVTPLRTPPRNAAYPTRRARSCRHRRTQGSQSPSS